MPEVEPKSEAPLYGVPVVHYPDRYVVSVLGEQHELFDSYVIMVELRGDGQWAVTRRGRQHLGIDGVWDYHLRDNDEAWLSRHRFALSTALWLARKAAPDVVVFGKTARQVYLVDQAQRARVAL